MMRVVILMGRGVEGCGITKYTVEMTKWLVKNGHEFKVIAAKDKKWSRHDAHQLDNLLWIKFSDDANVQLIIDECNAANVVVVNSLPSQAVGASKGHDARVGENFYKVIEKITKPIAYVQHDHNKLSIIRNFQLKKMVEASDYIFSHAPDNDFVREAKNTVGLGGLMDMLDDAQSFSVLNFQPGMDFDEVRSKYWKPISQTNKNIHRWIGRTTMWKGYNLMFDFHRECLKDAGYVSVLEGIEKSPAFIDFKQKYQFVDKVNQKIDDFDITQFVNTDPVVFSIFKNTELLERMSTSGYGYQLSLIEPRFIYRSIEYTHCEVAAVGTVPVFRKEYGDVCIHKKIGDPLSKCKDSGTIWLSHDNMSESLATINKLNADDSLRDEFREKAFEFYKSHQDSSHVFDELFNQIDLNMKKQ